MSGRAPRLGLRVSAPIPGFERRTVCELLARVWDLYAGPRGVRVEVALLDEAEHCLVHAAFLDDPGVTDVIAFPYADSDLFGEILLNSDCARREARKRGVDAGREARLYLAHGALHLLGFRDDSPSARAEMRAAERRVLRSMH